MVVASRVDGAGAKWMRRNCQHDQHTRVQHAKGQLDLETNPVMVVCRRHDVGGVGISAAKPRW